VDCNCSAKYTAFTHIRFAWLYLGADKSLAWPGSKQARKHVRDARDFNNIETWAVIKFFFFSCKARCQGKFAPLWRKHWVFPLPGRVKDLSSPLQCDTVAENVTAHCICAQSVLLGALFHGACTKERSPLNGSCRYILLELLHFHLHTLLQLLFFFLYCTSLTSTPVI